MLRQLYDLFANMSIDCRHGVYVWWLTAAALTGIMVITVFRSGPIAEHAVDDLAGILTTVVCAYLGIDVVSRSQVLNRLADRICTSPPPAQEQSDETTPKT